VPPDARVLVSAGVQRITPDLTGAASLALSNLLLALGLPAQTGGVGASALDPLVLDPAGLVRQRLAAAGAQLQAALASLLGPGLAGGIDLAARRVRVHGGGADATAGGGRFGWQADLQADLGGPTPGLSGTLSIGPNSALPTVGGLQLRAVFAAGQAPALQLHWHPAGAASTAAALWPQPDGPALLRMLAKASPAIGGHVALEMLRGLDASARPLIDAVLDAFGMLDGVVGDAERALRPVAGLIADPAGWLSSAGVYPL
jgi:hypothetical protein